MAIRMPRRSPLGRLGWRGGLASILLLITLLSPPAGAHAEEASILLDVPYRGQLDGSLYAGSNCGPATLAMVLAGYGQPIPIADIRATVNDLQRTWGDPDAGTAIENLGVIARRHGLAALDLADGNRLRHWSLDDVRRHLDAGHPVVPQVWYRGLPGREHRSYNGDHYITLIGYAGDEFIYHDPVDLDGIGPGARISAERLERAWRESDLPFAALAFAGPAERPSLKPEPTPTPAPTATATVAPTATPPPTATLAPSPTPAPSPTATAAAVVQIAPPPDASGPPWEDASVGDIDPATPTTTPWLPAFFAILILALHLAAALVGRRLGQPGAWRAPTRPQPQPQPKPARAAPRRPATLRLVPPASEPGM
jgi:hypothetical protein